MLFWPVLVIAVAVVVLITVGPPTDGIYDPSLYRTQIAYGAVLAGLLALFSIGRILLRGGRRALMHLAIWIGAAGGIGTAFLFQDQASQIVDRVRAELIPTVAVSRSEGTELRRAWDGHYRADSLVNGVEITLMVDTGASMVLLPYEDVARLGIDPKSLDYSIPVTTANGRSSVAPVTLSSIKIGEIAVFDVPAAVAQPGRLKMGLLGMSFLDRLDETTFRGDRLILRQFGTAEGNRDEVLVNSN
jgi:aspartyl protease family protein